MVGNNPISAAFGLGKEHAITISKRQYDEFKGEKFYGTYGFGPSAFPIIVLRDPDLIRQVMGKFQWYLDIKQQK